MREPPFLSPRGPSASLHRPVTCGTPGHGTQPLRPTKEPSELQPGLGRVPACRGEGPGLAGGVRAALACCGVWGQSLDLCSATHPPEEVRMDPVQCSAAAGLDGGLCAPLAHAHTSVRIHIHAPIYRYS